MAKDRIYQLTQGDLDLFTAYKEGNYYFTTDTQKLFTDTGNLRYPRQRLNVTILKTEIERETDIKGSEGKLYYVVESNTLWKYSGGWTVEVGTNYDSSGYYYVNNQIYGTLDGANNGIIDNNGLRGDGTVVIRDVNRLIKGQLSIDNLDNRLNISSFFGGGINLLPNGKMDELGTLALGADGYAWYRGEWNTTQDMYVNQMTGDTTYEELKIGDINFDGEINDDDLTLLNDHLQGTVVLTDKQLAVADINQDSVVDYKDYVLLENAINSNSLTDAVEATIDLGTVEWADTTEKVENHWKVWHEGNLNPEELRVNGNTIVELLNELEQPIDLNVKYLNGLESVDFAPRIHTHNSSDILDFNSAVLTQLRNVAIGGNNQGINVTYNNQTGKIDFTANTFLLSFTGDATGTGTITNLTNTVIGLTIDFTGKEDQIDITKLVGYQALVDSINDKIPKEDATTVATPDKLLYLDGQGLLPASITGNAVSASKLSTGRIIALTGGVNGSTIFDGSQDVSITATVDPSQHQHSQYVLLSNVGVTVAPLDSNQKVPLDNLPNSIVGTLQYQGTFDPTAGEPSQFPTKGQYWVSNGIGVINGHTYNVGDWIVYNGASWDWIDNSTPPVLSVNGMTGAVVIDAESLGAISSEYIDYLPFEDPIQDIPANKIVITNSQNHISATSASADKLEHPFSIKTTDDSEVLINADESVTSTDGTTDITMHLELADNVKPDLKVLFVADKTVDLEHNDIVVF